ncbi:MAG: sensor histidine kinase, partial [Akkermansiaceae bacterium]|nr:sensor histidine kinase [Akkermansiaceae bacterium]
FQSGERGSNVTHTVGSGLGLPFCRRVMEAHGGSIEVSCPPSGGATFLLRFPLPEQETE